MKTRILYHIAFWTAYVLYKSYLNFDSENPLIDGQTEIESFLYNLAIQISFLTIKIPLVYALFYVTDRLVQKQWGMIKTTLVTVSLFIIGVIGYLVVNQFTLSIILNNELTIWQAGIEIKSVIYIFFILGFVSGIAIAIKLIRLNIKQKVASQELLKRKLEIELQFLKAQTNPHFLFNTLNNIYALARKNSDKTPDVILKLSNMLRYMLYETTSENIAIENEIKIIDDYIEIEKLRYSSRLSIEFHKEIDNYKEKIAPLLLLPFVENAFKHGAGESRFESFIIIDLQLINGHLHFEIKNSKEESFENEINENIGLYNIKRQLELIYPDHELIIENAESEFKVKLTINLNDGNI